MNTEQWNRVYALFSEALDVPVDQRPAWVRTATEDEFIQAEVLSLLAAHDARGGLDEIAEELGEVGWVESTRHVFQPVPDRLGPYRVLRRSGQGGMGTVYLAERADQDLTYTVAIKVLRRDLETPELHQRFLTERQVLARIDHPNIARLLDGGITAEGQPFFVMEHVEGQPIDAYCDHGRLGIEERIRLFLAVCDAVQHAHRNLVVHRDIKPSNILVRPDGTPKLLDFGVVKVLDEDAFPVAAAHTRTGYRLLTPEYASPEQHRGEAITTASDVFQLGVLLYQLLSGRRPRVVEPPGMDGKTTLQTRAPARPSSLFQESPAPGSSGSGSDDASALAAARGTNPRRLARRLSGDLDNILLMALREEPERRYPSVEAFGEDLRRFLNGRPVAARPDHFAYIASKFIRRHWVGVVASAAIVALLTVSAVGMTVSAERTARERDRAQQVSSLLMKMFESASPDVSRGDTITVVQVLNRGAEQVRTSIAGQPDLEGTMLGLIAQVYDDLGQRGEAVDLSREALALRMESPGPRDPETIANLVQLASLLATVGRADSALIHAREAVDLAARHDPGSLLHGHALQAQSFALQVQGKLDSARPPLEEGIAILRDLSSDSAQLRLASALVNLAWMDQNRGSRDSAVLKMEESVEIRRRLLDSRHPTLANSLGSLAQVLVGAGRTQEAEPLLREALEIRQQVYPEGHPDIGESLDLFAQLLERTGNLDEAERHYREALSIFLQAYGERAVRVAQLRNRMGLFYHYRRGDAARAEAMLREATSIFREARGEDDPWAAVSEANLATAVLSQGRDREAVDILEGAIPVLESSYSPTARLLARPLLDHGTALLRLGEAAKAEASLRRAVTIESAADPEGVSLARAKSALGACLVAQGRSQEAEPLLLAARATLSASASRDPYLRWAEEALAVAQESPGGGEED